MTSNYHCDSDTFGCFLLGHDWNNPDANNQLLKHYVCSRCQGTDLVNLQSSNPSDHTEEKRPFILNVRRW